MKKVTTLSMIAMISLMSCSKLTSELDAMKPKKHTQLDAPMISMTVTQPEYKTVTNYTFANVDSAVARTYGNTRRYSVYFHNTGIKAVMTIISSGTLSAGTFPWKAYDWSITQNATMQIDVSGVPYGFSYTAYKPFAVNVSSYTGGLLNGTFGGDAVVSNGVLNNVPVIEY